MKTLKSGLASVCLVLLLSGCATTPPVVTETKIERVYPPAALTGPCPPPELRGNTNADLLDWALELQAELEACNADKAALRQWQSNNKKE